MLEVIVKPEMEAALEEWKTSFEYITREQYYEFYTDVEAAKQQLDLEIENGFVIADDDEYGLIRAATFIEFQRHFMEMLGE